MLEEGPTLAKEMAHPRRWRALHDLSEHGVRLVANARILEIAEQSVFFERPGKQGAPPVRDAAPADTVILASGLEANPEPAQLLREAGVPVIEIGDATGVGYIEGAVHDGWKAGSEV